MPDDFSELEARLTDTARASLERAGALARDDGGVYVGTEHILLGVLAQNSSLGAKILAEYGVTLDRVETALDMTTRPLVIAVIRQGVNAEVLEVIRSAWQLAVEFGQERIGTEHIIYSMLLQQNTRATKLLSDMNIDIDQIRGGLEDIFDKQQYESLRQEPQPSAQKKKSDVKILERFGVDLTRRASEGFLDPVIGREQETERLITVLGRRSKNNPALIGEPGVGKTAVVEGLAQRIADGQVPQFLLGKRVFQLDLTSMISGTKYRGQFEERLQKVIAAVKAHQEIILFIDELHVLVGAGSAEGSMDAANVLKPALARGEVRVIGATTLDEYRKHIEKDAALGRRFQAVMVNEPTPEDAVKMLGGLRERLAQHHRVVIPESTLEKAVDLSQRYMSERFLPDKAIDVIDEAASLLKSKLSPRRTSRDKLAVQIKRLAGMIDAAVEAENYQRAAELKVQMRQLELRAKELPDETESLPTVTLDHLYQAVSAITTIPLNKLSAGEVNQLLRLEKRLGKYVLGQNEAISQLARTIRRNKAGLSRQAGPLGSFIFLGPTGVGKTELARVLASEVFGGDNNLIKIDMSEFAEKHTVSRLVGAPAGYVGYDDGGKLTDRVRRQPYSVVLFDEIEKAHPDVLNLLLQLLEDGQLTDAHGRTVSFHNTIIILTSNVGADQMMQDGELGFSSRATVQEKTEHRHERNARAAIRELEVLLRPELIGRFDDVIIFQPLSRSVVGKIFDNLINDVSKLVEKQGMSLVVTPPLKRWLIDQGFDEQRGVRVLRRTIQSQLTDLLSDVILSGKAVSGDTLRVRLDNKKVVIDVDHS